MTAPHWRTGHLGALRAGPRGATLPGHARRLTITDSSPLLDIPETARALGVTEPEVLERIAGGELPAVEVDGLVKVPRDAVAELPGAFPEDPDTHEPDVGHHAEVVDATDARATDAFRKGQAIVAAFEQVVRDDVIPVVEESVAHGEDPSPILRGVAKALRTIADGIDPEPEA